MGFDSGSISAGINVGGVASPAGFPTPDLTQEDIDSFQEQYRIDNLSGAELELYRAEGQVAALSRAKGLSGPSTGYGGGDIGEDLLDWLGRVKAPSGTPVGLGEVMKSFVPIILRTGGTF